MKIYLQFLPIGVTEAARGKKNGVLNNSAIFTGKHLFWSFFLIVSFKSFRPATLLKRDSDTGVFL